MTVIGALSSFRKRFPKEGHWQSLPIVFRTWGEIQADRYIRQLEHFCQLLADNPAQ
jgi:hypothetical protein